MWYLCPLQNVFQNSQKPIVEREGRLYRLVQATEAAKTSRKRRQVVQAGTSTSDGSYEVGAF